MKSAVKTKAKQTNNQALFAGGGSLLKNNMEVEAGSCSGTWTKPVCTEFAPFMYETCLVLFQV